MEFGLLDLHDGFALAAHPHQFKPMVGNADEPDLAIGRPGPQGSLEHIGHRGALPRVERFCAARQ